MSPGDLGIVVKRSDTDQHRLGYKTADRSIYDQQSVQVKIGTIVIVLTEPNDIKESEWLYVRVITPHGILWMYQDAVEPL
jgi:hypothetical protein